MKILTKLLPNDQGPAFPNPLSTNHIVRALYIRAQCHPWVVKNCVSTLTIKASDFVVLTIIFIFFFSRKNIIFTFCSIGFILFYHLSFHKFLFLYKFVYDLKIVILHVNVPLMILF